MARILIIDDEAPMRELLETVLSAGGHAVVHAANGREGMATHQTQAVDIIVTDLLMPEMNGLQFARELRSFAPHVPIVAICGNPNGELFIKTAELIGRENVLPKPFALFALIDVIERLSRIVGMGKACDAAAPIAS